MEHENRPERSNPYSSKILNVDKGVLVFDPDLVTEEELFETIDTIISASPDFAYGAITASNFDKPTLLIRNDEAKAQLIGIEAIRGYFFTRWIFAENKQN